jgi:dynein intermediate chain 2
MAEYAYSKTRDQFGRQCNFVDRPIEVLANILPDPEVAETYIHRNPVDRGSQSVCCELSEHYVGQVYVSLFLSV